MQVQTQDRDNDNDKDREKESYDKSDIKLTDNSLKNYCEK